MSDLKKLKNVEEYRRSSHNTRNSNFGSGSFLTDSFFNGSIDQSQIGSSSKQLQKKLSSGSQRTRGSSRGGSKKADFEKMKIFTGKDSSEILKHYRKVILGFIKDKLSR